jgi:hypothetical protein
MRIIEQVDGFRVDEEEEYNEVLFFKRVDGWTRELVQEASEKFKTMDEELKRSYEEGYRDAKEAALAYRLLLDRQHRQEFKHDED